MLGFDVVSLLTLHLDAAQSKVEYLCATAISAIPVAFNLSGCGGWDKICVATRPLSVDSFNR